MLKFLNLKLFQTSTPSYTLTVCSDNRDFVILQIRAGPPYEDIAFKIVNQEWELQPKHGFKCSFDRGVLNLWWNFKRYWWRK